MNKEPQQDIAVPKKVRQIDAMTLGIDWSDGKSSSYRVKLLREKCPCAQCIDEWTGEKRIAPGAIPDSIHPLNLHSVGRYGLQIVWSDGHDTGIYTYEYLRRLDGSG